MELPWLWAEATNNINKAPTGQEALYTQSNV